MSIDKLQNKIRKLKNPSAILFSLDATKVPQAFQTGNAIEDYLQYSNALMIALQGVVPAVRFDYNTFAVSGCDGLSALSELLKTANKLDYYVLLDAPAISACATASAMTPSSEVCPSSRR